MEGAAAGKTDSLGQGGDIAGRELTSGDALLNQLAEKLAHMGHMFLDRLPVFLHGDGDHFMHRPLIG